MNVIDYLFNFYKHFNGKKGYIGKTNYGYNIPFFMIKKTNYPVVIVQGAIHAREFVTTYLIIRFIEDFKKNGKYGRIYFIPAVNIDGIDICLNKNPLNKANANQVDLNTNFDAKWGSGKYNLKIPSSENFIGEFPFSELETKTLRDFTCFVKPDVTLSFHSKGEEIYFDFYQKGEKYLFDKNLAVNISKSTNYKIKENLPSSGGYKDWCIEKLGISALTIEVGEDELTHPIKKEKLSGIYKKTKNIIKETVGYFMEFKYMNLAIIEAEKAYKKDEVPVGAVIVKDGKVLAKVHNKIEKNNIATHHAEILAIEKACKKLKSWRLDGAEMYVTLEPCAMCAGAIVNSRIKKVYFGAFEEKSGCAISKYKILSDNGLNHEVEFLGGIEEERCASLIKNYFKCKRSSKKS